jgi:hypothetical protein
VRRSGNGIVTPLGGAVAAPCRAGSGR